MEKAKLKFLCVCLSPAIDVTVKINTWPADGCVIKDAEEIYTPGGKGLNVARWLASKGADVACIGILGAENAFLFEKELAKYNIKDLFVRVPGMTRLNEMFVSPSGSFKINRHAGNGGLAGLDDLRWPMSEYDVIVISGSLPKGWCCDTYAKLILMAKSAKKQVVLDASGEALKKGIEARPDVVKPNTLECESLVGFSLKTEEDFLKATSVLKKDCAYPIISDGGNGCWFEGKLVKAPKVEVFDTTAAGDTLVAEWCWRRYGCLDSLDEAAKCAVDAASAACMFPGGSGWKVMV